MSILSSCLDQCLAHITQQTLVNEQVGIFYFYCHLSGPYSHICNSSHFVALRFTVAIYRWEFEFQLYVCIYLAL